MKSPLSGFAIVPVPEAEQFHSEVTAIVQVPDVNWLPSDLGVFHPVMSSQWPG